MKGPFQTSNLNSTPTLFISSVGELEALHKSLPLGRAKRDSPGYNSSVVIMPPENEPHLLLNNQYLVPLLKLIGKIRCRNLTFIRCNFTFDTEYAIKGRFDFLETLRLVTCRNVITFIPRIMKTCLQLVAFSESESESRASVGHDWYRAVAVAGNLILLHASLRLNYRILEFESSTLDEEIPLLMKAGVRTEQRKVLKDHERNLGKLLWRNHDGYQKCRSAIYQLFLIKKHRLDSVFRFVNRDVVKIIARLLYESIGTKIWCS